MGESTHQLTRGFLLFSALTFGGCASVPSSVPATRSATLISPGLIPLQTVVVDPGHGGHDPGTSHHGLQEKTLTLDIARRLQAELKARGLDVRMTRDRDEFIVLGRRPGVANRLQADLFVSVHINANRNRRVSGIEVYYPRQSVVDASAERFPPKVQLEEVALPTQSIKQILWDVALSSSRRNSMRMAWHICRAMSARLDVPCRGVHGARFVVLREAWMPAVLVEVGFVSNRSEALRLASGAYRQAAAEAIADGIAAYARERALRQQSSEISRPRDATMSVERVGCAAGCPAIELPG